METTDITAFSRRLNKALDQDLERWPRYGRRAALAREFKCSGEAARKWLAGEAIPRLSKAIKLANLLNVSVEWLLSGVGEMTHPDHVNVEPAPDPVHTYPIISWVKAGMFAEAIDNFAPGDADEWVTSPVRMSKTGFALRVVGNSMLPRFEPGRVLLVDPEQRGGIVSGDFVVARLAGSNEVTFKRFQEDAGRKMLEALNKDYPPITEPFEILGKVVAAVDYL